MTFEMFQDPTWLVGIAFVFGALVGSFLNVVIHRLPLGESIVFPASHCPGCDAPIAPFDNIPLVSYLLLRAKCRSCGVHISLRYPAVELVTAVVFAAIAWRFGANWSTLVLMLFAAALIAAALIDLDHQIIPDEISLGGLALGLVLTPLLHLSGGGALWPAVQHALLGALVGGGLLWIVGFAHARLSVAMGREFDHWPGEGETLPTPGSLDYWIWFPGLGFGDVKLLAMIGAFLGPWGVLQTIIAASLAGLALGIGWGLAKRNWASPFGFGPAIAVGAILVLVLPMRSWLGF